MKKLVDNYLSLVKHFILDKKKTHTPSIGLDIGTHSCKIVELIPTEDSFSILNWAIEPIGSHGLAETIKKILDRLDIETKSVYTSISGQGTLIRYLDMPKMPLADARRSFAIEADKYFPFAKEQIYTDCFIIDSKSHDNKMSLLVAAVKKELIEHRIQLLAGLGLQADFIGINSITIANIFNALQQKVDPSTDVAKSNAIAVLDIGESTTSLIILKDNIPQFTRDIFIGGRELNKSISNVLGVSLEEAEKIKCHPGDKIEQVLNACDAVLTNLASEIRLSFDYFATEHSAQISKLFLTGGSSLLERTSDFFIKNLDTSVEKWNPFTSLRLLPGVSETELNKNAAYLGVALGLALYQYD